MGMKTKLAIEDCRASFAGTLIYLILLVTMIGCSCNDEPAQKPGCVVICDASLNNCVKTLGPDHKLDCHKTYDLVCMPGCVVKR